MFKLRKTRRAIAVTAAAFALASATAIGTAGTAQAQATSCGSWEDIGSPSNVVAFGTYAGQVEQQFLPYCGGGGEVRGHFQWAGGYQGTYGYSDIGVALIDGNSNLLGDHDWQPTSTKDAYSWTIDVHTSNPDEYRADAYIRPYGDSTISCASAGTLHWYYNGANLSGPISNC
jgi:hypothetical protein